MEGQCSDDVELRGLGNWRMQDKGQRKELIVLTTFLGQFPEAGSVWPFSRNAVLYHNCQIIMQVAIITLAHIDGVLCARHHADLFTCNISFNFYNHLRG